MAHDGFRGVFPYLVSPIDERGRVKDAVLTRLVDDLIGASFRVNNPKAKASCGCGTSFAL